MTSAREPGKAETADLGSAKYDLGRKLKAIVSTTNNWETAAERFAGALDDVRGKDRAAVESRAAEMERFAQAWHRCVETILVMAGFSPALSAAEAGSAMQSYVTNVGAAEARVRKLEEVLRAYLDQTPISFMKGGNDLRDRAAHALGDTRALGETGGADALR